MAEVILKNVEKVYDGGNVAVRDFNLEIKDKEFMVFVGPSGCGKSTTLRMIAGLEEISSGNISIGDRVVNDVLPKDRDIAMVFQNYALYPHMTVYENMAFGLKLRKVPKQEIEQSVKEAAEILGITELLKRKPKALSGGQRQRVAVGRAIVRKPKVFLFDEPLSNLDAKLRTQMRTEIKRLHNIIGATMIYVTHDQTEAMTMGDRIVVMKDGLIQQAAEPLTLYNEPANRFVAGFIGMPQMNFFDGRIEAEGNTYFFKTEDGIKIGIGEKIRTKLKSIGKIILGLRPEDVGSLSALKNNSNPEIEGIIEVVEPLGSEIYLYLRCGTHEVISRVEASEKHYEPGQKISLKVNLSKAHFFDSETEQRI
ncbi:MAG: sn-glycerol-3-phosphate ABC transporter ATP-binding protein UgpC [Candidatus Delongbacteria bacterium]|jgi:multiple sugar transport system ATP-binding protein|nr:sn-glycerol-3-phosphate ABC transporter ATP-binding protein UgpC [Candidatus Delongbacteria bacterium]